MEKFLSNLNFDYSVKNISGLNNELKSLFLLGLKKQTSSSILVVTNSLYESNMLYKNLNAHHENTFLFPMDDFLTSVALASSPELKITRLETLNSLLKLDSAIVVTNLTGYLKYLKNQHEYKKSCISLKKGDVFDINDLANKLYDIGYRSETITNVTGDMSIRGYVVDVFPVSESNPIRLEFWGDQIDSIRVFDINTQLTIKNIDSIIMKFRQRVMTIQIIIQIFVII